MGRVLFVHKYEPFCPQEKGKKINEKGSEKTKEAHKMARST
jgi:hypothetical protein